MPRPTPRTSLRAPRTLLTATLAAALVGAGLSSAPPAVAEPGPELIVNGTFESDLSGWEAFPSPSTVDGRGCIDVPAGTPSYQAGMQQPVPMVAGETYLFTFEALSVPAISSEIRVVIQGGEDINYAEFLPARKNALGPEPQQFRYTFTADRDYPAASVTFQQDIVNAGAYRLCLDDVSLTAGAEPEPYVPETGPAVRVNQVGYLTDGPKQATVVTESETAQRWTLRDGRGRVVQVGRTDPAGVPDSVGLAVATIDFDEVRRPGTGYTLTVGDQTSYPFSIGDDLYEELRTQSKTFYYTNRSGIEIDDALAPGYGRAAGHLGVAPNQGDVAVPCLPLEDPQQGLYEDPWTCEGTRDVSGGWYDAGDHGKYVVNAGVSVSQLMTEYERTLTGHADPADYRDGSLSIPEAGNGVPDLLDEARWELAWMLRMQVPAGERLAGLVNHKVTDAEWTGLPLLPAADDQPRYLHRPSTAATLNLAASAAQGSRLFGELDPDFAEQLLAAAETAYQAAQQTPDLYAPAPDDSVDPAPGGGPYDDDDVSDEFYLAAAELYLTTGEADYREDVLGSPHHTGEVFSDGASFDWAELAGLARLQLATVPSELPDRDRVRASVVAAADDFLATQQAEAFGQAYAPTDGDWVWGSNSTILNNLQVVGTAYDITGEQAYADGVLGSLDYLFGRNALNQSYVTGWGSVYSQRQHSRWYAASLDSSLPRPPDGTLSGGPNSTAVQSGDPLAAAYLTGCVDQFCYLDEIGSWSTNEITINWNASMSWVSGFAAGL